MIESTQIKSTFGFTLWSEPTGDTDKREQQNKSAFVISVLTHFYVCPSEHMCVLSRVLRAPLDQARSMGGCGEDKS